MGLKHGITIPLSNLNFFWDAANIVSDKRTLNTSSTSRDLIDLSGTPREQFYITGNNVTWNAGNLGYRQSGGSSMYMQSLVTSGNQFSFCLWNQGATGISGYVFDTNSNLQFQLPSRTVISGVGVSIIWRADDGILNQIFKTPSLADIQGWTFWTGTKNATTGNMILYRNGEVYVSASSRTRNVSVSGGIAFYSQLNGQNQLANSPISMIAFYDKELSATEVKQFFDATRGRYGI